MHCNGSERENGIASGREHTYARCFLIARWERKVASARSAPPPNLVEAKQSRATTTTTTATKTTTAIEPVAVAVTLTVVSINHEPCEHVIPLILFLSRRLFLNVPSVNIISTKTSSAVLIHLAAATIASHRANAQNPSTQAQRMDSLAAHIHILIVIALCNPSKIIQS